MADVLNKKQRSYNMSRIGSKNTSLEKKIINLLSLYKIRGYKKHDKLPGNPDIVFQKRRLAVFIDGCFWHKCPRCFQEPATRRQFWLNKINGNVRRDKNVNRTLKKNKWVVLRLWEHEIRKRPERAFKKIVKQLNVSRDKKPKLRLA